MKIDKLVTSGTFNLDGGSWDVDNNVWVVGNDTECVVIDAAHDEAAIAEQVAGRKVVGILLTHAHDDHIKAAVELAERVGAQTYLHPADRMLWDVVFPDNPPDHELSDGEQIAVASGQLTVLHTPGHTPGSVCFLLADQGQLFTGDTLFAGGPGATGRSYSSFGDIIESIRGKLLTLPAATVVNTGHGDSTTIGAEQPQLDDWIARGY